MGTYFFRLICWANLENMDVTKKNCPPYHYIPIPVPRATVQFPRATVQFPHATVQFPRATVQFPRATVQSLFFFFGLPKAWYIFVFFFRQTIHPSIPVYLFFQIHTFFPIFGNGMGGNFFW